MSLSLLSDPKLFYNHENKGGCGCWGTRIIDRLYHRIRCAKTPASKKASDNDVVGMLNDISYPVVHKYVNREELEVTVLEVWRGYLNELEEGGGKIYRLTYKRPMAIITQMESGVANTFQCHFEGCVYAGSLRNLRHHYCGAHGYDWNKAVMETMKYQNDMLVLSNVTTKADATKLNSSTKRVEASSLDSITSAVLSGDVSQLRALLSPSAATATLDPNILLNVSRSSDSIPVFNYLVNTLEMPVNTRQKGGRGWGGRHILHWTMRNGNVALLNHLLLSNGGVNSGIDIDPVTDDGTGVLEYGLYGGNVECLDIYMDKIKGEGAWERVRGRRNKYGCNAALWAMLGKWCDEGEGKCRRVWGWVMQNIPEEEIRVSNGNGHTVMHKLAQRRAGEAAKVVGEWWEGKWGRDNDGLLPSELARAEGWKEGEEWFEKEEERRGIM